MVNGFAWASFSTTYFNLLVVHVMMACEEDWAAWSLKYVLIWSMRLVMEKMNVWD